MGESILRKVNRAARSAAEHSECPGCGSARTCREIAPSWIRNYEYEVLVHPKVTLDWWQSTNSQKDQCPRAKLLRGLYSIKARHKRQQ